MNTKNETTTGNAAQYTPVKGAIFHGDSQVLSVANPAFTQARRCVVAKEVCDKLNSFDSLKAERDAMREALEKLYLAGKTMNDMHRLSGVVITEAILDQARAALALCGGGK